MVLNAWMGVCGWMDGCKIHFKDSLQQPKIIIELRKWRHWVGVIARECPITFINKMQSHKNLLVKVQTK